MAKINIKDAGKFTNVGSSEYFTLKMMVILHK